MAEFTFYEFFCGGGMARAGLGPRWRCAFANDFDREKAKTYIANWGAAELKVADVTTLEARDLPGRADLAWASFPCQDFSLAGLGAGLNGERSAAFWPFWRLISALARENRAPNLIVLENVLGALTSKGGGDFRAILSALADAGYVFGALILDAVEFVPQSRPRLFVLAVADGLEIPAALLTNGPSEPHHPAALVRALTDLPEKTAAAWRWWRLAKSARRNIDLVDILEDEPTGVRWRSAAETQRLVSLMSPTQQQKLADIKRLGARVVGAVYRRTRRDEAGKRVQRAEARFDGLAGCLRTPAGGSSRQTLLIVEGEKIMSRLISPREAARLMGLADSYRLPESATDAYHLIGDGVVAPLVRRLAEELFAPILFAGSRAARRRA
jgi:DNA (cytosine-5)-methyltransferase 1